ncbi:transposable element Tc1 transposase [Trichonephila clavipes]|nr:transposable element Tc1 transposase [Trichonephila clavipes]
MLEGLRWRHLRNHVSRSFQLNVHGDCAATETRASRGTVSKRLHERGLFARRPTVCVPLTFTNRRVPLAWRRQYRFWSMDQWVTVLFADESHFSLNTDSPYIHMEITRDLPSIVFKIDNYSGGGLMVWAGIILDDRTLLNVFKRDSVTGVRPHRALLGADFLDSENIPRMVSQPGLLTSTLSGMLWGGQLQFAISSENHTGYENSVVERVEAIATRTDKLPYFKILGIVEYGHFRLDDLAD